MAWGYDPFTLLKTAINYNPSYIVAHGVTESGAKGARD